MAMGRERERRMNSGNSINLDSWCWKQGLLWKWRERERYDLRGLYIVGYLKLFATYWESLSTIIHYRKPYQQTCFCSSNWIKTEGSLNWRPKVWGVWWILASAKVSGMSCCAELLRSLFNRWLSFKNVYFCLLKSSSMCKCDDFVEIYLQTLMYISDLGAFQFLYIPILWPMPRCHDGPLLFSMDIYPRSLHGVTWKGDSVSCRHRTSMFLEDSWRSYRAFGIRKRMRN